MKVLCDTYVTINGHNVALHYILLSAFGNGGFSYDLTYL